MEAEPRSASDGKGDGDALVELARLSRAQRDAANAGRFDEVRSLLRAREGLLDQFRGRGVEPREIDAARAFDAETRRMLQAEIRRIEVELSRLTVGSQTLSGYLVRAPKCPAFVDHVR